MDVRNLAAFLPALLGVASGATHAEVELGAARFSPLGSFGQCVVADFDEDGHLDILAKGSTSYSVHFGNGLGYFIGPLTTPTRPGAGRTVTADFDEDGHADIATLDDHGVWLHFGNGSGSFPRAGWFRTSNHPTDLAAADFNQDGHVDLAVADGMQSLSILLGDGRGAFAAARPLTSSSAIVRVSDFNEDGHADLLLGAPFGMGLMLGTGTGDFTPGGSVSGLYGLTDALIGDFVEDGHFDVVLIGGSYPAVLSMLAGTGTGNLTVLYTDLRLPASSILAAADLDEDGHLDLVLNNGLGGISVRPGDGTGAFARERQFYAAPGYRPIVGDFDEDGHLDVAAANPQNGLAMLPNLSFDFDPVRLRTGNVNRGRGPVADVLLVDGLPGSLDERRVSVDSNAQFVIRMNTPPSNPTGPARFALYGWTGEPTSTTVTLLPRGLGKTAMPTPLTGGSPAPRVIWNNIGQTSRLGPARFPSLPAPSIVVNLPRGLRRSGHAYLQGIIMDSSATNRLAAVTNGVVIETR